MFETHEGLFENCWTELFNLSDEQTSNSTVAQYKWKETVYITWKATVFHLRKLLGAAYWECWYSIVFVQLTKKKIDQKGMLCRTFNAFLVFFVLHFNSC